MHAAAMRILEADRRYLESVDEGIASADHGELIDHEEVVAEMERWFAAWPTAAAAKYDPTTGR
jgi:predicted transcriptional regulator